MFGFFSYAMTRATQHIKRFFIAHKTFFKLLIIIEEYFMCSWSKRRVKFLIQDSKLLIKCLAYALTHFILFALSTKLLVAS